jgi:hypothetical protein
MTGRAWRLERKSTVAQCNATYMVSATHDHSMRLGSRALQLLDRCMHRSLLHTALRGQAGSAVEEGKRGASRRGAIRMPRLWRPGART